MKFRRIAILLVLTLAMNLVPLVAQDEEPPPPEDPRVTRDRNLKEHDQKIREIIRKRQEEAKQKAAREAAASNQVQNSEAEPTGEASLADVGGAIEVTSSETPSNEKRGRALGATMLYYNFPTPRTEYQLDTFVKTGQEFISEVVLLNDAEAPLDRLSLALSYDKRFVEPVKVFDSEIRKFSDEAPEFRVDSRAGVLYYDIKFSKPVAMISMTPLRIIWKASRPTSHCTLNFVFETDESDPDVPLTAVWAGERNILGLGFDAIDGVLGGGVTIEADDSGGHRRLQGKASDLREVYLGEVGAHSDAGLAIVPPDGPIQIGDIIPVQIKLANPGGTLVDSIDFLLEWDPQVFRMVDRDRGNWVKRGINAHDGPYTRDFPFDTIKYNEVRNDRGTLRYSASLTEGRTLPSGTFVTAYLKAIRPSDETAIRFLRSRPGEANLTSIRYFGFEISLLEAPLSVPNIRVKVLNPPAGYVPFDASKTPVGETAPAVASTGDAK